MAQPIYCDYAGCQDPEAARARFATWMIQRLDGTLAEAYCEDHWPIMAVVLAAGQAEASGTTLDALLSPPEPGPDEPDDSDEPQVAVSPQDGPGAPQGDGVDPEPTHVVKRGTSRSRRAHQARKREREQAQADAAAEA